MIHQEEVVAFGAAIRRAREVFGFRKGIRRIPGNIPEVVVPSGWGTGEFGARDNALATHDHVVKRWPSSAWFVHVHHVDQTGRFEGLFGLGGRNGVLNDERQDFIRVFVEEFVNIFEGIDEEGMSEFADVVAEVEIVIPDVGIEEHGANAVLELAIHAEVLVGGRPALFEVGHGVVGGRKCHFVEVAGAKFGVSVAFRRGRDLGRLWRWVCLATRGQEHQRGAYGPTHEPIAEDHRDRINETGSGFQKSHNKRAGSGANQKSGPGIQTTCASTPGPK